MLVQAARVHQLLHANTLVMHGYISGRDCLQ